MSLNHYPCFLCLKSVNFADANIKKEKVMCTAISVTAGDHYFGRNLDYETGYGEKIVITPRNYPFSFDCGEGIKKHYAIIGMGIVKDGYPLYFDAINESGLGMAGLLFSGNAVYGKRVSGKKNVASFELIPWVLAKCKSVDEAEKLIEDTNITDDAFSDDLPPSPLHWIIADKKRTIVLEVTADGMRIYPNPLGVLTNNPPFEMQMYNLSNYIGLSSSPAENRFAKNVNLSAHSKGMGAVGLPGDLSSMSRFVKTAFVCANSVYSDVEEEIVNHFFHTLYAVFQQKGCVATSDGYEITQYSSCCNTDKGIYYYTTYNNSNITAVSMHGESLDTEKLIEYELIKNCKITMQNRK